MQPLRRVDHRHQLCRLGDACRDPECGRTHPWDMCRFAHRCTRPGCAFAHPWDMCRFGAGCALPECQFIHAMDEVDGARLACRYFPACKRGSECPFFHPEVCCKFGVLCSRPGCAFLHNFEDGLSIPCIVTRLLTLLLAEAERLGAEGEQPTTWISLSMWQRCAASWPLNATGTTRRFKQKELLACVALSGRGGAPPVTGVLSTFKLGGAKLIGFPPPHALATGKTNQKKRKADAYAAFLCDVGRSSSAPSGTGTSTRPAQRSRVPKVTASSVEERDVGGGDGGGSGSGSDDNEPVGAPFQSEVDRFLKEMEPLVATAQRPEASARSDAPQRGGACARPHGGATAIKGGIGFQMLVKMGWRSGGGLGIAGQGRLEPVAVGLATQKDTDKRGLGARSRSRAVT